MAHKLVQHTTTLRVLELLHMDLMGPMQVESMGGKRYVFVCVDDFLKIHMGKLSQGKIRHI